MTGLVVRTLFTVTCRRQATKTTKSTKLTKEATKKSLVFLRDFSFVVFVAFVNFAMMPSAVSLSKADSKFGH